MEQKETQFHTTGDETVEAELQRDEEASVQDSASDVLPEVEPKSWDEQIAVVKKDVKWRKTDKLFNILLWVAIVLLLTLVLVRSFVITNVGVDGSSMENTYFNGDVVWANKLTKPNRGDVVVFYKHDVDSKFLALFGTVDDNGKNGKYEKLIKRVVAIEGDAIWAEAVSSNEYKLKIKTPDGTVLEEDYYVKNGETLPLFTFSVLKNLADRTEASPHIVPEGHFYAMGDNRDISADSRGDLGDVPYDRLFGVVMDK